MRQVYASRQRGSYCCERNETVNSIYQYLKGSLVQESASHGFSGGRRDAEAPISVLEELKEHTS